MKIGVLTHLSPSYPLLVSDFLTGLKLTLGEEHEIVKTYLSADASDKTVEEEAQKLLIDEVDCLISYTSATKLELLQEVGAKMGKTSILLDSGSQPRDGAKTKKQAYWLSLQLMESAYLLGKRIGNAKGERVAILSDFINSGYQMAARFVQAVTEEGGDIYIQHVVPQEHDLENQLDQLANALIEEKITIIYVNAHGEEGELLLSLSQREDIRENLPHLKWCIGNQLLQELDHSKFHEEEKIYACSSWHEKKNNTQPFKEQFEERTKRKPSALAVIAHEAGMLLSQIETNSLADMESPRGQLVWNEKQNSFQAAVQIYTVNKSEVKPLTKAPEFVTIPKNKEEVFGGWKNAYLCY